jgi:hypothetical protein
MSEYIVNFTKISPTGMTFYDIHTMGNGTAIRFRSIVQAEQFGNDQLNKPMSKTSANVIWFDVVKI